ncbi:putative polygalacturonase [Heracleum sosnowskyi]|uniref:Polygalacturonase n=1 Tax=Heracleum sosnowskyi TaxID=360622 RepID=A0AAD8HXW8_9APIA|nr:putative polygalacturonase [Heracleum sosnowskyi]
MGTSTNPTNQVMDIVVVIASVVLLSATNVDGRKDLAPGVKDGITEFAALNCRAQTSSIMDFGGIGDGKGSNTKAFRAAVEKLGKAPGGGQLIIPPGKYLTGPFNLSSHFTLYLQKDAVILASPDEGEWTVVDALPSYGKGKEPPFGRFNAFISGCNLTDVVITGDNGTIDGQGRTWWDKAGTLKAKRPNLIELVYSKQIQISNITLINSPSYHIHPTYSSDVIIQGITVLTNVSTNNTDAIVPDSCNNTRIEDCYINTGEDCISIKSGWDAYGLGVGMPTSTVTIRRITCIAPDSSLMSIGSEMSGGVKDIRIQDCRCINTQSGLRIKSSIGRGAYVRDVFAKGITMENMQWAFYMTGNFGSHPDNKSTPTAVPVIENINFQDINAKNVTTAGQMGGVPGHPYKGICLSNTTIQMAPNAPPPAWNCSDITGSSTTVTPPPCPPLAGKGGPCKFPTDKLPIESVKLKMCPVHATGGSASPSASPGGSPSSSPAGESSLSSLIPTSTLVGKSAAPK